MIASFEEFYRAIKRQLHDLAGISPDLEAFVTHRFNLGVLQEIYSDLGKVGFDFSRMFNIDIAGLPEGSAEMHIQALLVDRLESKITRFQDWPDMFAFSQLFDTAEFSAFRLRACEALAEGIMLTLQMNRLDQEPPLGSRPVDLHRMPEALVEGIIIALNKLDRVDQVTPGHADPADLHKPLYVGPKLRYEAFRDFVKSRAGLSHREICDQLDAAEMGSPWLDKKKRELENEFLSFRACYDDPLVRDSLKTMLSKILRGSRIQTKH